MLLGPALHALEQSRQLRGDLRWSRGLIRHAHFIWLDLPTWEALVQAPAAAGPLDVVIESALDDPSGTVARFPPAHLSAVTYGDTCDSPELAELHRALPRVSLTAHSRRLTLHVLRSDTLARIHLHEDAMPAGVLSAVFASELPRLEELVFDLGWTEPDLDSVAEIARFAATSALPSLRRLGLRGGAKVGPLIRAIAGTPLAGRLAMLDVSLDPGGDADSFTRDDREMDLLFELDEAAKTLGEAPLKIMLGLSLGRAAVSALGAKHGNRFVARSL